MPDDQLKQRVRWDVYLLMLRGIAMFMMIGFAFFLVAAAPVLAEAQSAQPDLAGVPGVDAEQDPGNLGPARPDEMFAWNLRYAMTVCC